MKRTPARGGKEPETMCLQAVGALWLSRATAEQCVTACLLHNDPASYRRQREVKVLRTGAIGKPSLNRATVLPVVDPKLRELPMSRMKRGLYRVEVRTHLG